FVFFFFQAEDGIRDGHVTGVQTCAFRSRLCRVCGRHRLVPQHGHVDARGERKTLDVARARYASHECGRRASPPHQEGVLGAAWRSEERRVGKGWGWRWEEGGGGER